jgi:hypothetical protein
MTIITIRKLMRLNERTTHPFDRIPRRILQKMVSDIPRTRRNVTSVIQGNRGMGNPSILIIQRNNKKDRYPKSFFQIAARLPFYPPETTKCYSWTPYILKSILT